MPKLHAAVIGLGVGERHVAAYLSHPQIESVVLCDTDPQKLAAVGQRYPQLKQTRQEKTVLTDPAIDLVSIASYDSAHARQISLALRHDKHVFVEKPLCRTTQEGQQLRRLLQRNSHLFLSARFPLRLIERLKEVQGWYYQGKFGHLYYLEGDYNYGRIEKITAGWRRQEPNYSVMLGGGIHIIDWFLWLTKNRVTEVMAYGNNLATMGSRFAADDCVVALLKFQTGQLGKVTSNFGCVYPHTHLLALYGTNATFRQGAEGAWLIQSRDEGTTPLPVTSPYPGEKGRPDHLHSFIDAIIKKQPPAVTSDEVFAALSVCLAIDKSHHLGRPVKVSYL